uniref:Kazal-like domain-containing protein n=1 Tax=Timema cristinae TaxID=61476 RepID=A0A7R9CHI6_TIMCR|nr:unnamed protein product [Timema cristinae]
MDSVNPCVSVHCQSGQECAITKYGIAQCECPPECEPVMRPVCGKDGRTYDSSCELGRVSCLNKKSVEVAYTGSCEFDPACGSDGISYGNECKLRLEACQHTRKIDVLYKGLCNGCENKKCDHYAICESDGTGTAKCVCPESCIEVHAPTCGTDGNTYNNECELRVASCRNNQFVVVAYKGDCGLDLDYELNVAILVVKDPSWQKECNHFNLEAECQDNKHGTSCECVSDKRVPLGYD